MQNRYNAADWRVTGTSPFVPRSGAGNINSFANRLNQNQNSINGLPNYGRMPTLNASSGIAPQQDPVFALGQGRTSQPGSLSGPAPKLNLNPGEPDFGGMSPRAAAIFDSLKPIDLNPVGPDPWAQQGAVDPADENPWDQWAQLPRTPASNGVANLGGQVGSTLNSALLGGYLNAPSRIANETNSAYADQMYLNQGASLKIRQINEQAAAREAEAKYRQDLLNEKAQSRQAITGLLGGLLGGGSGGTGGVSLGPVPSPQPGGGITAGPISANTLNQATASLTGGQIQAPQTSLPVQGGSQHLNDAFRNFNAGNQVDFSRNAGAQNEQLRQASENLRSRIMLAQQGQLQGQQEDNARFQAGMMSPLIRALLGGN